jgi:hypothetical protein
MHYGRFSKENQRWLKVDAERPVHGAASPESAETSGKRMKRDVLPATEQGELPFSDDQRLLSNARRS